jgi:predicted ATPase
MYYICVNIFYLLKMQSRLIVKNFGPIEEVDLELRNVNVFIGPQASGKSALAKIYTICKSPMAFIKYQSDNDNVLDVVNSFENFQQVLQDYNIASFWRENTMIEFNSELHFISISKREIVYDRKIYKKIAEIKKIDSIRDRSLLLDKIVEFDDIFINFYFHMISLLKGKYEDFLSTSKIRKLIVEISNTELSEIIELLEKTEKTLSFNPALYIPAERSFIPIIAGSSLSLLNNGVPIPKHLLLFGSEYEKSRALVKEIDLNFITKNLKYMYENGVDSIYIDNLNKIKLTEAASGVQSVVPLLLPIQLKKDKSLSINNSFVIEEPELNLFPKTQYSLINNIEKNRVNPILNISDIGAIHTYTTHSPYILSSFNNFLFTGKVFETVLNKNVSNLKEYQESLSIATDVLKPLNLAKIRKGDFAAYQICNGRAESIVDAVTGLIKENFIDEASDEMQDDFDSLIELMKEYDTAD